MSSADWTVSGREQQWVPAPNIRPLTRARVIAEPFRRPGNVLIDGMRSEPSELCITSGASGRPALLTDAHFVHQPVEPVATTRLGANRQHGAVAD
jgi:hypothetical protein